jgi:hypothetical protein
MATEAAWLKRKKEKTSNKKGKRKTDLTLTGLLMEGPTSLADPLEAIGTTSSMDVFDLWIFRLDT